MVTLYALLVGVDAYRSPVRPLRGCRADVADAATFLLNAAGPETAVRVETLLDEDATREGVIEAFRKHLGQAGSGDTALFWFSGHGSTAPLPRELWHSEAEGRMQTLLCADSRHDGVPDLYDKELALLIREVAGRGAHTAVVLDCCHAESGTRLSTHAAVGRRWHQALDTAPPADALLPELRATALPPGGPDHVELAACRSFESAHEVSIAKDRVRGAFSLGLLEALRRLGGTATYREAMVAARCYVENLLDGQVPRLYPIDSEIVDRPFLGGQLRRPDAPMVMRYVHDAWEIDAGSCHGLAAPPAGESDTLRVGVPGANPAQEARILEIFSERSTVEPIGWAPHQTEQYPVVLTSVPLPPTPVAIGGFPDDDQRMAALVAGAVATASPTGGPSPHVRRVDPGDPDQAPELTLATPADGTIRILGAGGKLLAHVDGQPGRPNTGAAVADLHHIARWRQVRKLANPLSRLANQVRLEVVEARSGELYVPLDRAPLRTDENSDLRLSYQGGPSGWTPPSVFIRLHNTAPRRLYCALLNLTDRFRIHADLFPGTYIAPRVTVGANRGEPIEITLPPGRSPRPGAVVEDWLLLIVAETEFSSAPFALPRLGEPVGGHTRSSSGIAGVLERLGMAAVYRDAVPKSSAAYDWTTTLMRVETTVPA